MNQPFIISHPEYFPLLIFAVWLAGATLLGIFSGWYKLMGVFPDQEDMGEVLAAFSGRSGTMGAWVGMNGILTFEARKRGLRIRINRIFGIFSRPIFVPWEEITILRNVSALAGHRAVFLFGYGGRYGRLSVDSDLADLLGRGAGERWPEKGPVPAAMDRKVLARSFFLKWMILVLVAPPLVWGVETWSLRGGARVGSDASPPLLLVMFFSAVVFGIVFVLRYFTRSRAWPK